MDAALFYAEQGQPVFPCDWRRSRRKRPLTEHGHKDATADPDVVSKWWSRWPIALVGSPTGLTSVVLDIDLRSGGFETIAALGFPELPKTPTVRTAGDGRHLYFQIPDPPIGNTTGARGRGIGTGLDWRGVGGYVILPAPNTGYEWLDDTFSLPLAPIPAGLMPKPQPVIVLNPERPVISTEPCSTLSAYGRAALWSAAERILTAPNGEQETTLNGECYSIGQLAGRGDVPPDVALQVLLTAAGGMPSYDSSRPWQPDHLEYKVHRAFDAGFGRPRPSWDEIEREFDRLIAEAGDAYEDYDE